MRGAIIRGLLCIVMMQATVFAVCRLPQPRLVCQEYYEESVVVVGKLMRIRHVGPNRSGNDGNYYYFEVVERLRGKILNRFQLYEENSSGRATFGWKRGDNYVLFISYSNEDRGWELDGCGNSAPMASAKKVLDQIVKIKAGQSREMIQGFIASAETLPGRLSVSVAGGGKSRAVMVENREFKLRVEPGTYVVTPSHAGWQFQKDEFSYNDPQKIRIEKGGCAQIQFQATPIANPQ